VLSRVFTPTTNDVNNGLEENCILIVSRSVFIFKYYPADQVNTICILCQVLPRWPSKYDLYSFSSITPLTKSIRSVFFVKYYPSDQVNMIYIFVKYYPADQVNTICFLCQVLPRWPSQYDPSSLSSITPLTKSIWSVFFAKCYPADQVRTICILCQVLHRWPSQYDLYSSSSITPLTESIRSVFFVKYYSADQVNTICILR
jgi:hypothetical protein